MTAASWTTGASAVLSRRSLANGWGLLIAPSAVFLVVFFGYPLVDIVAKSFSPESGRGYGVFTESSLYLRTLETTFTTAATTTAACLLLGYPYAYVMSRTRGMWLALMAFLVLLPLWTSALVRTYAWQVWLQDTGVINSVLQDLGIIDDPLSLVRNRLGVTIGMTQILLPFMVLPLYSAMRRIDPDHVTAAQSLGARPLTAFRKVFVPLSMPGIISGSLLVFVTALGFFIVPAILGGPENALISTLIVDEIQVRADFGTAAALGVVLLVATLLVLLLGSRFVRMRSLVALGDDS